MYVPSNFLPLTSFKMETTSITLIIILHSFIGCVCCDINGVCLYPCQVAAVAAPPALKMLSEKFPGYVLATNDSIAKVM